MTRFALMLAALMLAVVPAALGVLQNDLFAPETTVPTHHRTSEPAAPLLQRPEPKVDHRTSGKEDLDSGLTERRQAHNEGDD